LIRHVWPKIRQQLPTATLHIHGAYCTSELHQAAHNNQNKNNGISVHGFTPKLQDIFRHGSILLAPLRFGAGIKGKIVDAWTFGMPVVTTPIGSEGTTFKKKKKKTTTTTTPKSSLEAVLPLPWTSFAAMPLNWP
jgi:glycosyltransferase involved in cell wall biosynthesis